MNKDKLFLCYIQKLNPTSKKENGIRFYFTDQNKLEDVVGEDWGIESLSQPPYKQYVSFTYDLLTTKVEFELLEENDFYCYNPHGVNKIIALAWEDIEDEMSNMLVFHFGETVISIEEKLFSRELAHDIDIED